jgi:hypothetical protein
MDIHSWELQSPLAAAGTGIGRGLHAEAVMAAAASRAELQAATERRVRQLSDELSAAYQKTIELQDCKRTEASMLEFLQDAISASHSHDSNRLIASAMADLHQKIIATL